LEERHILLCL
jgi:hypothetical protein